MSMTWRQRRRWLIERVSGWWFRRRVRQGRARMGRQYVVTTSLTLDRVDGTRAVYDQATNQWIEEG